MFPKQPLEQDLAMLRAFLREPSLSLAIAALLAVALAWRLLLRRRPVDRAARPACSVDMSTTSATPSRVRLRRSMPRKEAAKAAVIRAAAREAQSVTWDTLVRTLVPWVRNVEPDFRCVKADLAEVRARLDTMRDGHEALVAEVQGLRAELEARRR